MPNANTLTRRDRDAALRVARTLAPPPGATYRLQFHKGFPLSAARAVAPYLAQLGITHVYASPIWASTSGSLHGYDIVDFGRIDDELGGREEFERLVAALTDEGMGILLDFVPNHMGIKGGANPWWQDVLENGQASPYAAFFDIDWQPLKPELRNQVLVPVLADQFGIVLERGELRLGFANGEFSIDYFGTPFPIAPPTYPMILRPALEEVRPRYAPDDLPLLELESLAVAFERLTPNDKTGADQRAERQREQLVSKRRLSDLIGAETPMQQAVTSVVDRLNGTVGDRDSFDAMESLLGAQSYRLAYWRVAAEEINYRRFFAINELAALRQEAPEVFDATHRLLLDLVGSGTVSGVRVDHPDGLWDPKDYLQRLQFGAFARRVHDTIDARRSTPVSEEAWSAWLPALTAIWEQTTKGADSACPLYVLVEKILESGEQLPEDWPVAGTVGYEFARVVTGLFVDTKQRKAFDELYVRFTGERTAFADLVYQQKKHIMRVALASEVNVLARALDRLTERDRRTRDFTLNNLTDALREIIACFPVYRTYATCEEGIDRRGRRAIDQAVDLSLRRNPASDRGVFEFIRRVLLLQGAGDVAGEEWEAACHFVMKFQQLTGPVMAKGVEDTAFYRYNRLLSLNEVGGDPGTFGASVGDFHSECALRSQRWPAAMLASSTHDTKRSEDVRARISALSEAPRQWRAAVNRWARMNRDARTRVQGAMAPDRNDEYHLYQTLVGIWPFEGEPADSSIQQRLTAYMIKAVREAQVHSSWINPNEEYEQALISFLACILDTSADSGFIEDVRQFVGPVSRVGAFTSLSQQLLKLTAPGVPDIYQGTELWDFSLVDPDNRRPVDFTLRTAILEELATRRPSPELAADLLADLPSGRIKLFLTARALAHRARLSDLYAKGGYEPLDAQGPLASHLVAYRRTLDAAEVIVVVPRLLWGVLQDAQRAPVADVWRGTVVQLGGAPKRTRFVDELTGREIEPSGDHDARVLKVEELFESLPFALLSRD